MPAVRIPIRYRHNPSRGWRGNHGRKTRDERSGFWSYENLLAEDDFGVKVDVRYSTWDFDQGADTGDNKT